MNSLPPIPAGVVTLDDHETHARTTLDANAWAYFAGGAANEHTVRTNADAWRGLQLLPRVLRPLAGGHTRVSLLGRELAHPILLAPVAYQRLAHPDGEIASALAASALQAGLVLSTQASTPMEDVARAFGNDPARGPLWFQLYSQPERSSTLALIRRAEDAGYHALVWTVDAHIKRSSYPLPEGVTAANLRELPTPPRHHTDLMDRHILFGTALAIQAPSWDELAWLRAQTRLPVIVKGILSATAAARAVALGADAIVVSNHGGRVLDGMVATIEVLPALRAAVPRHVPLLLDSGVRYGTDILKALALGASAVMVGRPIFHALAVAGMLGVAHMLHLLRAELELAMAQTGCCTLEQIAPSLLAR